MATHWEGFEKKFDEKEVFYTEPVTEYPNSPLADIVTNILTGQLQLHILHAFHLHIWCV